MKNTMNKRRWTIGLMAAGCALGVTLPNSAMAEVSDADFKALKEAVQKLNEQVQKLQQTHQADEQTHQKDAEQILQLQQKLGETQQTIAIVQQNTATPAMQTVPRAPIDEATVNHNFLMLGDAEFQYAHGGGQHGGFMMADFAPIFLYRGGENILFETGFDFILQNNPRPPAGSGAGNTTTLNLSFAQLDYVMNDYMTLVAGNMLLPLGTYSERSAGWLNKFPDSPLARNLLPGAGVGAQLRGAIPVDDTGKSITYSVFGVNGPSSADGTGTASQLDLGGNVGFRTDNAVANLHGSPAGGGRLGLFMPFKPHYDFEIGISGEAGQWDDAGQHLWMGGVIDASLHLGPNIEVKGEFVETGYGTDDVGNVRQQGWWVQAGYKLAGLNLELPGINNLELLGRYDSLQDGFGNRTHRYSVGCIYYLTNTLLLEGDYEFLRSTTTPVADQLILQLSYGF